MAYERFPAAYPLQISQRQIVSASGDSTVQRTVPCARRGGAVPLEVCLACVHGDGVVATADGHCSFLRCRLPPEPSPPRYRAPLPDQPSPAEATPVSAAMTSNVICVRDDLPVDALTELLMKHGISGVPVVDAEGFPIGVVSKTDVLRARGSPPGPEPTVGDIMTAVAFTLREDVPVAQAAALMAYEGIHRLPVVSLSRQVVGILSALDILRWMAQHDGYMVRELRECLG